MNLSCIPISKRLCFSSYRLVQFHQFSMSAQIKTKFGGIYPPITTPFSQDESISWDKLRSNMEKFNQTALKGFLVQGSNGEYCYMTSQERIEMIRKVRDFAGPDKLVLAGSGCESTLHTIQMTQKMAEVGADAAVVITPHYFKSGMTGEALSRHFEAVASDSPIPVLLYNVPKNTGVDMDVKTIVSLAKHPNIVGMKESSGDIAKISEVIGATLDQDFFVLAGSANFLLPALKVGAIGGICALANVLPEQVCQLQQLLDEGKEEEALSLHYKLQLPNKAVTAQFGVPGLKHIMDKRGYYGGPLRRPLLPLTDEKQIEVLTKAFTSNGF